MNRIARALTVAACCALFATACGSQEHTNSTKKQVAAPAVEKPQVREVTADSLLTPDDLDTAILQRGWKVNPNDKGSGNDDKLGCETLDAMNRTYEGEHRASWMNADGVRIAEQVTNDPEAAADFSDLMHAPCTHWKLGDTVFQVDPVMLSNAPSVGMTTTFWTVGDITALAAEKDGVTVLLTMIGYTVDGSAERLMSAALSRV